MNIDLYSWGDGATLLNERKMNNYCKMHAVSIWFKKTIDIDTDSNLI
jgi:hypothetical protein